MTEKVQSDTATRAGTGFYPGCIRFQSKSLLLPRLETDQNAQDLIQRQNVTNQHQDEKNPPGGTVKAAEGLGLQEGGLTGSERAGRKVGGPGGPHRQPRAVINILL